MHDLLILGTDTDVGKTSFALLWLTRFADRFEYWKPVESGEPDSAHVARCVPSARVHPALFQLQKPVAPPLAARLEGKKIPPARELAGKKPRPERPLLIETFGGPFSPLNDDELQVAFVQELACPCLLVTSSKLGGIGRTLQALAALRLYKLAPFAIVILGPLDPFMNEELRKHAAAAIIESVESPEAWTPAELRKCVDKQTAELDRIHVALTSEAPWTSDLPRSSETRPSGSVSTAETPDPRIAKNALKQLLAEDRRCVWHPYTSLLDATDPLPCVGASEEFLELADGRRVIDGISSWWTILHGHRHRPLMQALTDAAKKFDHVLFAGVTHPSAVELADLLLGTMPWFGGRVFYSDNGSTAVEVALKMAYQYWCHKGQPGRTRFVGFEHGYHGDTFGAMAVSRDPLFFGRFEPLLFQTEILPLVPSRLEHYLQDHANDIAAVILEPLVQGAGGMRMHSKETLREIVDITRRHGVLFIADEVMTGGGRTGTLWAHQAAGVVPDLLCTAKTLTGGILPLAATLVAPSVVEAFLTADRAQTFFHGHSFTANPLACAVAVCNYRILRGKPMDAPLRIASFWSKALEPLQGHLRVKEVRIQGTIAAVEMDLPGGYLAESGRTLAGVCLKHDVFLRPLGSVLYAMPPLCVSAASLERIAAAMIDAVRSLG